MQNSKIICGIDIGTSKITTVIGQYFNEESKLNIIAVSSSQPFGFRKGQIIDPQKATNSIEESIESAERMAGIEINKISVSITAPYIETINTKGVIAINNPNNEIDQNDVNRVIEAAKNTSIPPGKEIIHCIPRKYFVDGQEDIINPIGMNGNHLEIEAHLILASSPALKNIQKCFQDLDIDIDKIIFSGLASSQAVVTETDKELGVALIDIGGTNTTLTIFLEGSPFYSTVIPIGGNNITNDLAIGLRLPLLDAEKIKHRLDQIVTSKKFEDEVDLHQLGLDTNIENKKISLHMTVNGIIKPRLEEIFSILRQKIEESQQINSIPAGIVLTGGGSLTIDSKEICSQIIPLPLRLASPPQVNGLVDEITNPAHSSTIGLLMYLIENTQPKNKKGPKTNPLTFNNFFTKIKSFLDPLLP